MKVLHSPTRKLTPAQAADELDCARDTIVRWILSGHLPAVRTPGGRYLIDEGDLERVLKPVRAAAE